MKKRVKAIVLAAGKGTRMKSSKAKVLHEVFSGPMIHHVLNSLLPLGLEEIIVVTGHQAEEVEASLAGFEVTFARQREQLGTGHAVLAAGKSFADYEGTVMILCGDTPLIRSVTLARMISEHQASDSVITVMSTILDFPTGYGRIITGPDGEVVGIVEEKDATTAEKAVREINAGVYCVESGFLREGLKRIGCDNSQGEFYLTDLIGVAIKLGQTVNRCLCTDPVEVLGVNSPKDLEEAGIALGARLGSPIAAEETNPLTL
ncbi:MAG: NTP transferase domain-containing protein [Proteobacteria bacterium]|nr:NTP transferase domain-containing protein [Pseudomonadota bacterium]MBU1737820.1 NTP transferase domain-containing protein [Pseudomonadota bacterium]